MSNNALHLYDVVFMSHINGLSHIRIGLTDAQANNNTDAVNAAFDEEYQVDMGDSVLIKPVKPSDDHILCRLVYSHRHGDNIEMAWLPKDYKTKDDAEIVNFVYAETFLGEDHGEFLSIEELPESELNIDVVNW